MSADRDFSAPLLVVAAALMRSDGRILVQQRPIQKHHGGLWEFPGGKVEPGETPEQALSRELAEELGIAVTAADATPITFATAPIDHGSLVLLLYRVTAWDGEPRALESPALQWLTEPELSSVPMPPVDLALLGTLIRRITASG